MGGGGGGGTYLEGLELEDLVLGEAGGEGDGDFVVGVVEGGGHFVGGGGGVDAAMLSLGRSGEEWSLGEKWWCCSEFQECCCGKGSHRGFGALKVAARLLSQLKHCRLLPRLWREARCKAVEGVQMRLGWRMEWTDGGLPPDGRAGKHPTPVGKNPDGKGSFLTWKYLPRAQCLILMAALITAYFHLGNYSKLKMATSILSFMCPDCGGASPQRTRALRLPRTASQSPCKWTKPGRAGRATGKTFISPHEASR